ncbi:MAG: hypothetical protein ACK54C_09300, partial [Betaproteobacteria bacterium]
MHLPTTLFDPKKPQLTAARRTKSLSRLNNVSGGGSPVWNCYAVARIARKAAPKLDLRCLAAMTTGVSRLMARHGPAHDPKSENRRAAEGRLARAGAKQR